jgi:tRNA A-37 threonylcarbamoyl transferase component Bud32
MLIKMAGAVAEKTAQNDLDRQRLGREVDALRHLVHPGVVAVVAVEDCDEGVERLVLRRVPGRTWADIGTCPAPVGAGWGAAVATIVADLHDLGYAHGALSRDHVLIDEDGRPVLCGFGDASPLGRSDHPAHLTARDVQATARMVLDAAPGLDRRARRRLARYTDIHHHRRLSARALAVDLIRAVPDARLGHREDQSEVAASARPDGAGRLADSAVDGVDRQKGVAESTGPSGRRRPHSWPTALSAVAAILAFVIGIALVTTRPARARPSPAYVLRSASGERTLTVTGRWGCGSSRPIVLDTASGSLWVFDRWPAPGQRVTARFLTRVPGATGLGVAAGIASCQQLVVLRANQPDLDLTVGGSG